MGLVVLVTASALFQRYSRGRMISAREGLLVSLLWLVLNLAMDYPMFSYGPMRVTPGACYSEIGLGYLMFPAFGFWASRSRRHHQTRSKS